MLHTTWKVSSDKAYKVSAQKRCTKYPNDITMYEKDGMCVCQPELSYRGKEKWNSNGTRKEHDGKVFLAPTNAWNPVECFCNSEDRWGNKTDTTIYKGNRCKSICPDGMEWDENCTRTASNPCCKVKIPDALPEVVLGCMNSDAINFNNLATEDDGSCKMPLVKCGKLVEYKCKQFVRDGEYENIKRCKDVLEYRMFKDHEKLKCNPQGFVDDSGEYETYNDCMVYHVQTLKMTSRSAQAECDAKNPSGKSNRSSGVFLTPEECMSSYIDDNGMDETAAYGACVIHNPPGMRLFAKPASASERYAGEYLDNFNPDFYEDDPDGDTLETQLAAVGGVGGAALVLVGLYYVFSKDN